MHIYVYLRLPGCGLAGTRSSTAPTATPGERLLPLLSLLLVVVVVVLVVVVVVVVAVLSLLRLLPL